MAKAIFGKTNFKTKILDIQDDLALLNKLHSRLLNDPDDAKAIAQASFAVNRIQQNVEYIKSLGEDVSDLISRLEGSNGNR